MPDYNPQVLVSPVDFADTGQWHLIIYISERGMRAVLRHVSDKSRPMAEILSVAWSDTDHASLLKNIENAVYDHPGLLDDYATEIILETPRVCFAPQEILDSTEDSESIVFSALFPGESQEVLADPLPGMTVLYSMVRGLDGFFSRTIPGARLRSHLAVIVERFGARQSAGGCNVYLDVRRGHVDVVAFRDARLLSASVQEWRETPDIVYRVFNLLDAYGIDRSALRIHVSGHVDEIPELIAMLRRLCPATDRTQLPANPSPETPFPLALLLQSFKK